MIFRIWNRVDEGKAPRQETHTQIYKDSSFIFFFFFFYVGEQQQIWWQFLLKSANFQNPVLGSSLAQTLLFCWYIFELDFVTKKGISLFKGKIWVNFDKNSDFTAAVKVRFGVHENVAFSETRNLGVKIEGCIFAKHLLLLIWNQDEEAKKKGYEPLISLDWKLPLFFGKR